MFYYQPGGQVCQFFGLPDIAMMRSAVSLVSGYRQKLRYPDLPAELRQVIFSCVSCIPWLKNMLNAAPSAFSLQSSVFSLIPSPSQISVEKPFPMCHRLSNLIFNNLAHSRFFCVFQKSDNHMEQAK